MREAVELGRARARSEDLPLVDTEFLPPGRLAERAGITVARTQPIRLTGAHAVAIRRFDREPGRRIHALSAGTALVCDRAWRLGLLRFATWHRISAKWQEQQDEAVE